MPPDEVSIQRAYYTETAGKYDDAHADDHGLGLGFLITALEFLQIDSVLDIGSGTGRVLFEIRDKFPNVSTVGIEPSEPLRKIGHSKGLLDTQLIDGDGAKLVFPDNSFDLVCEFAVLHHVRDPHEVVSEMLRVARKAIFISDCNNFGQGGQFSRWMKQSLNATKLWDAFNYFRTGGKGYMISKGDGLFYSYSVFNNYNQIAKQCKTIHILNTNGSGMVGPNLYRTASSLALLGVKH